MEAQHFPCMTTTMNVNGIKSAVHPRATTTGSHCIRIARHLLPDYPLNGVADHRSSSPANSSHSCPTTSTVTARTPLHKLSSEKKAKRMRFYRNGDKYFKGALYAFSAERVRTMDALLEDLNRILVDQVSSLRTH